VRTLLLVTLAAAVACSAPSPEGGTAPPIASRSQDALHGVGLDLRALPSSLDGLSAAQVDVVMRSFVTSLGIDCKGCHDPTSDAASTERLRIAARMWSDFVVARRFADNRALYCDSCHQGRATFLERDDTHALGLWMERYFRDGLALVDHRPNDCRSCHGTPFDPSFLNAWASGT
jgi:hypothetical protein